MSDRWKEGDEIQVRPVDKLAPEACEGTVVKINGELWVKRRAFMDVKLKAFEKWGTVTKRGEKR